MPPKRLASRLCMAAARSEEPQKMQMERGTDMGSPLLCLGLSDYNLPNAP
jgi:hypothetical protein